MKCNIPLKSLVQSSYKERNEQNMKYENRMNHEYFIVVLKYCYVSIYIPSNVLNRRIYTMFVFLFVIGFPGQIRKFDTQIHFNFIQIRQFLSCRESYDSNSFSYHSI